MPTGAPDNAGSTVVITGTGFVSPVLGARRRGRVVGTVSPPGAGDISSLAQTVLGALGACGTRRDETSPAPGSFVVTALGPRAVADLWDPWLGHRPATAESTLSLEVAEVRVAASASLLLRVVRNNPEPRSPGDLRRVVTRFDEG